MPTYEYRCSAGHEFEHFQRMSEEPLRECTVCGAPAERLLSAGGGLLFKGSGFYITDYRSDSYRKAAEADSGPKADAGGGGDSGSKGGEPAVKSGESAGKGAGDKSGDTKVSGASSKSRTSGSATGPKDSGGTSSSKAG